MSKAVDLLSKFGKVEVVGTEAILTLSYDRRKRRFDIDDYGSVVDAVKAELAWCWAGSVKNRYFPTQYDFMTEKNELVL